MKSFNTAGICNPNEHYMVDITDRVEIIRGMVARGDYICINRGRQYGKTTTLEFDEVFVAQMIRDHTAGYPFLVSRLCHIIDVEQYTWDNEGVLKAVNALLKEGNTLFDDMQKKSLACCHR